jgi:hypothetical protein
MWHDVRLVDESVARSLQQPVRMRDADDAIALDGGIASEPRSAAADYYATAADDDIVGPV